MRLSIFSFSFLNFNLILIYIFNFFTNLKHLTMFNVTLVKFCLIICHSESSEFFFPPSLSADLKLPQSRHQPQRKRLKLDALRGYWGLIRSVIRISRRGLGVLTVELYVFKGKCMGPTQQSSQTPLV